jgi:ribosomal protein S19
VFRKVRIAAEMVGCTVEEFVERATEKEAERALLRMSREEQVPPVENGRSIESRDSL